MRRALLLLICTAAAILPAAGMAAGAQHRATSNLLIDAQEWSLWPSRSSVPAGTIYVELWNRGQDVHDTWVRRLNSHSKMVGPVLDKIKQTLPGDVSQATWHLKAGKYELFCSMPGHMKMGMHARLTVT
jgi:plastocyanin